MSNAKWGTGEYGTPGGTVTWAFASTPGTGFVFSQYITESAYRDVIRDAFQAWEDVADIDFVEVSSGSQTDIQLGWDTIDGAFGVVGEASTLGSKTTATLFSFTQSEIRFDIAENWTTERDVGSNEVGLYQVALHEIGHAIGLGHTQDPDTIMYASNISGLDGLTPGDIAGAQAFYGAADTAPQSGTTDDTTPPPDSGRDDPADQPVIVYAATRGNDTFGVQGGDTVIDGMAGIDTVTLTGDITQYTLTMATDGIVLTDRVSGRDGTNTLISIEQLDFQSQGESFDIGIRSGATYLSQSDFASITELYIAYFDRAPASKGLLYWATRLEEGMSLPEIAESFFVQPETQRTYAAFLDDAGNVTDTQAFVSAVFNNVLGRDPSSTYWVDELDTPGSEITPAIFILAVLNGAKAASGGAADAAFLDVKTDLGVYFAAIKGLSDYDDTVAVMEMFDGSASSVSAAVAEIDRLHSEALDPDTGAFLMPLVGVIDDPFAVM
ncbi:matrixin family metalloprotease [Sulfitobacter noctilucicola]|nr:matrixin family metalloprotease [Sulfitobacter noctilucicola]